MPLKKKLKTNKKQPRKQRTVATNKNTNTNKITVNVGSKTTSKRYTRNGSTQGARQQYASAPYPVYNAARPSGFPGGGSSTTIVNTPAAPILQPQNGLNQKDLTSVKDDLLARLSQPLQAAIGYDPDFQNVSNDVQDLKDAHRLAQQERALRRQEHEQQRLADLKEREAFYNYISNQNMITQNNMNLLGENVNKKLNSLLLPAGNTPTTSDTAQQNSPLFSYATTDVFGSNPMFEKQPDNIQPVVQPSTLNLVNPSNIDPQFNNVASKILNVTTLPELGDNEVSVTIDPKGLANTFSKDQFLQTTKDVKKVYSQNQRDKYINDYIELYNKLNDGVDPSADTLYKFSKV